MSTSHGPHRYRDAPTSTVSAAGAHLAYRETGARTGVPLVVLTHLGANLDGWDPRIVDGLAQDHHVIALDYRGVGRSTERVRDTIEEMADDIAAAIRALGYARVDLVGLSMGGMVAQALVDRAPELVDRLVLASSGPPGGTGLTRMTRVMLTAVPRAVLTATDPTELLFFTRTAAGRTSAREYRARLAERTADRDARVGPGVFVAQLRAVRRWGEQRPTPPSAFTGPVLVLHGDSDIMVPPVDATELAARVRAPAPVILADSGHGAVFQHHDAVVAAARDFLRR